LKDDPRDLNVRKAIEMVEEASALCFVDLKHADSVSKCTEAAAIAENYPTIYEMRCVARLAYLHAYRSKLSKETVEDQLTRAEDDAIKFANLYPSSPWTALRLAELYNSAGGIRNGQNMNQKSKQICDKALESENLDVKCKSGFYCSRGNANAKLKNLDQAEHDFNEAIRLDPEEPMLYINRADYWRNRGQKELADADMATVERLREKLRKARAQQSANSPPS
jgi:tetratricopeptide (TPR) repeat protein